MQHRIPESAVPSHTPHFDKLQGTIDATNDGSAMEDGLLCLQFGPNYRLGGHGTRNFLLHHLVCDRKQTDHGHNQADHRSGQTDHDHKQADHGANFRSHLMNSIPSTSDFRYFATSCNPLGS